MLSMRSCDLFKTHISVSPSWHSHADHLSCAATEAWNGTWPPGTPRSQSPEPSPRYSDESFFRGKKERNFLHYIPLHVAFVQKLQWLYLWSKKASMICERMGLHDRSGISLKWSLLTSEKRDFKGVALGVHNNIQLQVVSHMCRRKACPAGSQFKRKLLALTSFVVFVFKSHSSQQHVFLQVPTVERLGSTVNNDVCAVLTFIACDQSIFSFLLIVKWKIGAISGFQYVRDGHSSNL